MSVSYRFEVLGARDWCRLGHSIHKMSINLSSSAGLKDVIVPVFELCGPKFKLLRFNELLERFSVLVLRWTDARNSKT